MSHLTIRERRALADIERRVTAEDPEFARALARPLPGREHSGHLRRIAGYGLLLAAGAALVLASVAAHGVGAVLAVVLLVGVVPSCLWLAAEAFARRRRTRRRPRRSR
ncbi:DUF3040 domain-containing protein [Kitasatospora sp. NPDC057015]|uniref:DUF3040 domain-containing protein n=1 Tax=Kitasatospora sp. NPDC057015 TaxID=3346001 RepID=UPI003625E3DE